MPDLAVVRADAKLRAGTPYPVGPESFGLVVEVVSPASRKTDRFAKLGEYAEAGIPFMWRVETEPELVVHALRLGPKGSYREDTVLTGRGRLPAPWGEVEVDLDRVRDGLQPGPAWRTPRPSWRTMVVPHPEDHP